MIIILRILYLLFAACFANASVLPVEKCNLEDSACMVPAFQKALPMFIAGMPDLDIEVLDVLEMDYLKFDLAGLKFTLKDGRLKGLKNTIIDDVKWDLKKKFFEVKYHVDCTVNGHYTADGSILVLPITGDGQMKLKLKNLHVYLRIDYEMGKGADGKDHVVPNKLNFDFEVKDNAHFTLTNLFNGNKELSEAMLKFLNENWKQVSQEFGRPMMEVSAKKLYKNVAKFFEKIPIDDVANV